MLLHNKRTASSDPKVTTIIHAEEKFQQKLQTPLSAPSQDELLDLLPKNDIFSEEEIDEILHSVWMDADQEEKHKLIYSAFNTHGTIHYKTITEHEEFLRAACDALSAIATPFEKRDRAHIEILALYNIENTNAANLRAFLFSIIDKLKNE